MTRHLRSTLTRKEWDTYLNLLDPVWVSAAVERQEMHGPEIIDDPETADAVPEVSSSPGGLGGGANQETTKPTHCSVGGNTHGSVDYGGLHPTKLPLSLHGNPKSVRFTMEDETWLEARAAQLNTNICDLIRLAVLSERTQKRIVLEEYRTADGIFVHSEILLLLEACKEASAAGRKLKSELYATGNANRVEILNKHLKQLGDCTSSLHRKGGSIQGFKTSGLQALAELRSELVKQIEQEEFSPETQDLLHKIIRWAEAHIAYF